MAATMHTVVMLCLVWLLQGHNLHLLQHNQLGWRVQQQHSSNPLQPPPMHLQACKCKSPERHCSLRQARLSQHHMSIAVQIDWNQALLPHWVLRCLLQRLNQMLTTELTMTSLPVIWRYLQQKIC